jgi:menaquinone-specific isochorismate synthase
MLTVDLSWLEKKLRHYSSLDQLKLISYTQQISMLNFDELLQDNIASPRFIWIDNRNNSEFIGLGKTFQITHSGKDRFKKTSLEINQLLDTIEMNQIDLTQELGPRFVGGFSFTGTRNQPDIWSPFAATNVFLPKVQFYQISRKVWITINSLANSALSIDAEIEDIKMILKDCTASQISEKQTTNTIAQTTLPVSIEEWKDKIKVVKERFRENQIQKVVLSRIRRIECIESINHCSIITNLKDAYPNCIIFLIEPEKGRAFFGATPEILSDVFHNTISTVALAGSIGRSENIDEDQKLGEVLLSSVKDIEEHEYVRRQIQELLIPISEKIKFDNHRSLLKLTNIQHLYTGIQATTKSPNGILPIVELLHPTPAVGGYPRADALEVINELEGDIRGWYAAPVGWINREGDGTFCVAIRSAVEIELKFQPILQSIS